VGGKDAACPEVPTAVPLDRLRELMLRANDIPAGFGVHPKLERLIETRREMCEGKNPLDWGAGELLAFASLVTEGYPVRLSGQDARRGTISHRHAVLHVHVTGRLYTPLARMVDGQARFEVWDSPLSEAGVELVRRRGMPPAVGIANSPGSSAPSPR
jgi:2-oxoglutarate dehydrogenase E1 component